MPAGQVNLRGSLPRSESNVLEPMFHPEQAKTEEAGPTGMSVMMTLIKYA